MASEDQFLLSIQVSTRLGAAPSETWSRLCAGLYAFSRFRKLVFRVQEGREGQLEGTWEYEKGE